MMLVKIKLYDMLYLKNYMFFLNPVFYFRRHEPTGHLDYYTDGYAFWRQK